MALNDFFKKYFLFLFFAVAVCVLTIIYYFYNEVFQGYLYLRSSSFHLVYDHVKIVLISSLLSVITGIGAGVLVTRKSGRDFLPGINTLASFGQTFPPVAVLALCVPFAGFGFKPTIIALTVYGIFPVLRSTAAGLESVSADLLEAAEGMGMNRIQILYKIEIPLAAGIIMGGVRISVIINTGTAALGATIGAGGLGAPIVSGLVTENFFYVLHGGLLVGCLAVLTDRLIERAEVLISRHERKY